MSAPTLAALPLTTPLVRSPLNYTGGKSKLLPQLLPLFPEQESFSHFVDAFGGGGNVVANVSAATSHYNDIEPTVTKVLSWMCETNTYSAVEQILDVMIEYNLSRENTDAYFRLRDDYNNNPERTPAMFFALVAHGFNNQIRFNRHGHFNIPFGKRTFNDRMFKSFTDFSERLKQLSLTFTNHHFAELSITEPDSTLVYCDPPYLITSATYNVRTGNSAGWSADDESELEDWLDALDSSGVRWALSNVTHHQGKVNEQLLKFAEKYRTHELTHSYANVSYHKKDRTSATREVLITNY